jgi:hypothetical protein
MISGINSVDPRLNMVNEINNAGPKLRADRLGCKADHRVAHQHG